METGNIVLMKNSLMDVPRAITFEQDDYVQDQTEYVLDFVLQRLGHTHSGRSLISVYRLAVKPYDRWRSDGFKFGKRSHQCATLRRKSLKLKRKMTPMDGN